MNNKLVILCLLFVLISPWLHAEGYHHPKDEFSPWDVEVRVVVARGDGNSPDRGLAVLSLFDSEESFLENPVTTLKKPADQKGVIAFHLSDLSDKYYSVSVFFDEDENGELNTNFFGIPSEPVGFSNNAKGRFGPPSFEQTKFKPSDHSLIEIRLITIGD